MKKLRIGFDVDGILADFNVPYRELIHKHSPIRLPQISDAYPNTWSYDKAAGISPAAERAMWKEIEESESFWFDIPAYEGIAKIADTVVEDLSEHDFYFITSRPGNTAKVQTEEWLSDHFFEHPTVLISSQKGTCCLGLKLTHYIDDRVENCEDVHINSPKTKCFMLARPWNRKVEGVPRLNSVLEFLDILKKEGE